MKLIGYAEKKDYENKVRIQIGRAKPSGITAPIKGILVDESNVDEVYNLILKVIKENSK